MIEVSEQLRSVIDSDSRTFKVRILHGNNIYGAVRKYKQSVKLPDSSMSIGNALCSMIECSAEDAPTSIIGAKIEVQITAGDSDEWIPLGKFKAERPTLENGTVKFSAFDAMNEAGNKIYKPGISEGEHTAQEVFEDICKVLQSACVALPDDIGRLRFENILGGYSCRDALAYLAGFIGRNCLVNRYGLFEMKPFTAVDYDKLNADRIADPKLSDADSVLGYIACCIDGETTLQSGTGSDGFEYISPIITQSRLNLIGGSLMAETSPVRVFRTAKIKQLLGDPTLDICDVIALDFGGSRYTVPVMALSFDFDGGLSAEIESFDFAEPSSLSLNERLDFSAKQASKEATKYSEKVLQFSSAIGNAMGLYQTAVAVGSGTIIYSHDKPTLSESTYICCRTAEGFAVASSWGGTHENTVWQSGFDREGNAILKMLTAFKIRADQIEAGSVTADKIKVTDLSALKATIANWVVHSNLLYVPSEKQEDGSYSGGVGFSNTSYAFYAGYRSSDEAYNASANHPGSPWERKYDGTFDEENVNFYITRSGKLVAKNAEIAGKIAATDASGTSKVVIENGGITCYTTPSDGLLSEYGSIKAAVDENVDKTNPMFCIQSNITNAAGMVLGASKNSWYALYQKAQTENGRNYCHKIYGSIKLSNNVLLGGNIYTNGKRIIGLALDTENLFLGTSEQSGNTYIYANSKGKIELSAATVSVSGEMKIGGKIAVTGEVTADTHLTVGGRLNITSGIYTDGIRNFGIASNGTLIFGAQSQAGATNIYARSEADAEGTLYGIGLIANFVNCNADFRVYSEKGINFRVDSQWNRGLFYGTVNSLTGLHIGVDTKPLYLWCSEVNSPGSVVLNTDVRMKSNKAICFYNELSGTYKRYMQYATVSTSYGSEKYGSLLLGDAQDYMILYGTSVLLNGATTVTSDIRLKKDIEPFGDKHECFFSSLKPKIFKYTDGTSGRKHFGFIAQEVETSIVSAGLTTNDVAAFVSVVNKDGGETLTLRYDEFISLNTYMIQKNISKIASLEEEIKRLKEIINYG